MSEDKIQRRRFLADVLFAAGALSAAALVAKGMTPTPTQSSHTPEGTPLCSGTPMGQEAPVPGQMRAPVRFSPGAAKVPLPHPEGDVVQPKSKETQR
jgi:hypothetical protein